MRWLALAAVVLAGCDWATAQQTALDRLHGDAGVTGGGGGTTGGGGGTTGGGGGTTGGGGGTTGGGGGTTGGGGGTTGGGGGPTRSDGGVIDEVFGLFAADDAGSFFWAGNLAGEANVLLYDDAGTFVSANAVTWPGEELISFWADGYSSPYAIAVTRGQSNTRTVRRGSNGANWTPTATSLTLATHGTVYVERSTGAPYLSLWDTSSDYVQEIREAADGGPHGSVMSDPCPVSFSDLYVMRRAEGDGVLIAYTAANGTCTNVAFGVRPGDAGVQWVTSAGGRSELTRGAITDIGGWNLTSTAGVDLLTHPASDTLVVQRYQWLNAQMMLSAQPTEFISTPNLGRTISSEVISEGFVAGLSTDGAGIVRGTLRNDGFVLGQPTDVYVFVVGPSWGRSFGLAMPGTRVGLFVNAELVFVAYTTPSGAATVKAVRRADGLP